MTEAVLWLADVLTGRLATVVATLAVAGLGFLLLRGMVSGSRALAVVAGIAVVASAQAVAAALVSAAQFMPIAQRSGAELAVNDEPSPSVPYTYDPYAGAAVAPPPGPESDPFR